MPDIGHTNKIARYRVQAHYHMPGIELI